MVEVAVAEVVAVSDVAAAADLVRLNLIGVELVFEFVVFVVVD